MKKNKDSNKLQYAATGALAGGTLGLSAGLGKMISTWGGAGSFNNHQARNKFLLPYYGVVGALIGANAGLLTNSFTKTSEDKKPVISNGAKALIAAGIGAGTFALARHGFNKTPDQLASKGKLTWAIYSQDSTKTLYPKTLGQKIKKVLDYGDTQMVNAEHLKGKKIEGALYMDADLNYPTVKIPKSDIGYNTNKKVIIDILQNKKEFGKLKNHITVPTKSMSQVVGNRKFKDEKSFLSALVKTPEEHYYKPSVQEASAGEGHFTTTQLRRMATDKKYNQSRAKEFSSFYKERRNYIAQKPLDLELIPHGYGILDEGMPRTERRVHFTVSSDNKVKVLRPISQRWFDYKIVGGKSDIKATTSGIIGSAIGATTGAATSDDKHKLKNTIRGAIAGGAIGVGGAHALKNEFIIPKWSPSFDRADLEKKIQTVWSQNKQVQSKSPLLLGADVVSDKKGKKWMIEVNDQSGFLHPAILNYNIGQSHKVYKAITGRDTTLVSAAKGIAAAGATGAALSLAGKKKEQVS